MMATVGRTDPRLARPARAPSYGVHRVKNPITGLILRFAGRLRFPILFVLTSGLFVLNLLVPDPLPFADEILLGLFALLLGSLRDRPTPTTEHPDSSDATLSRSNQK